MFFTFVKSLENEEEKVQILILFFDDLDFTNETEFGYFFIYDFCCNFRIVLIYVFFSSPWIGQVLSFPHIPSHWNPLYPLVKHCSRVRDFFLFKLVALVGGGSVINGADTV